MDQLDQVFTDEEPTLDKGRASADPAVWEGVVFIVVRVGNRCHSTPLPLLFECLTPGRQTAVAPSVGKSGLKETFVCWHESLDENPC
jgi:hypothetical protein